MKVCKDCCYYYYNKKCLHPKAIWYTDPVNGYTIRYNCTYMRENTLCGTDAKLFKEVPSVWEQIKWILSPGPKFQA